jgi:hypothetical protein
MKNILSAFYGANNVYVNVLQILLKLLTDNNNVIISNHNFGDPIPGFVKSLIIEYDNDSTSIFKENSTIKLNNNIEYPVIEQTYQIYYSLQERNDGFGAQFQTLMYAILYAESEKNIYVYTPIKNMQHNYDNRENFIEQIESLMNIKNNYLNINNTQLLCAKINELKISNLISIFDKNLDYYLDGEPIKKLKNIFWQNKNKNVFKNNKFNIAVHVRRPNSYDDRINGTDTPNDYYLNVINNIRKKHNDKELLFHIYSQGNIKDFEYYKNDDVILHIDEELSDTYIGLVGADILVMSASSLSYSAALLSDGEIYYIPFWHSPSKKWINGCLL